MHVNHVPCQQAMWHQERANHESDISYTAWSQVIDSSFLSVAAGLQGKPRSSCSDPELGQAEDRGLTASLWGGTFKAPTAGSRPKLLEEHVQGQEKVAMGGLVEFQTQEIRRPWESRFGRIDEFSVPLQTEQHHVSTEILTRTLFTELCIILRGESLCISTKHCSIPTAKLGGARLFRAHAMRACWNP